MSPDAASYERREGVADEREREADQREASASSATDTEPFHPAFVSRTLLPELGLGPDQ